MGQSTLFPGAGLRNKLFMVLKMENTFLFPEVWSNWTFCNSWRETSPFWDFLAEGEWMLEYEIRTRCLALSSVCTEVFSPNVHCCLWSAEPALVFLVPNPCKQPAFVYCPWGTQEMKCEAASERSQQACLASSYLDSQEDVVSQSQPCRLALH